jgi:prephenate dehydratase
MATAFLGPRGTFSEEAAIRYADGGDDFLAFSTIPALTSAVETGLAAAAVLPIENSIEGPVGSTLDLLIHETPLKMVGEVVVPIRHMLVTAPGSDLGDITVVSSHPQALGQCRRFLQRCLPDAEQVAALSTAGAVERVATGGDPTRAAIGPARAAELYGGQVIARDIQDIRGNLTRFIALAPADAPPTGDDKTSLGLTLKANVPGALFKVLQPFADERIQMTKLESRPTKGWLGDYVFLIDLEGHQTDAPVQRTITRAREQSAMFKIFGSYPRFPVETLRDLVSSPALLP